MNAGCARDQLALSGMVEIHVEQPASASIDDGVLMKEFLLGCSCPFRLNDFGSLLLINYRVRSGTVINIHIPC